jgi:hypothetical protein
MRWCRLDNNNIKSFLKEKIMPGMKKSAKNKIDMMRGGGKVNMMRGGGMTMKRGGMAKKKTVKKKTKKKAKKR